MIFSLMYLTDTRPDILFVVNTLRHVHLMVAKHALRYLKGTVEYGIKYEVNQKTNLEGYVDSEWADNSIERKNTSGCLFNMRSGVISWFSRKESCMVLIIAEVKYVSNFSTTWERGVLKLHFVIQIKMS